jgi:mannose-6-phosphate isomerase-like protein (cupin superfamily)
MNDLVHDPIRRQRYRFSRVGDVLTLELWADPGGEVPEHLHPSQEERFEVRSGRWRFTVDGAKREAGPGERLTAPAGSRHRFENIGAEEGQLVVEVEPAGRTQEFLERAAELARAKAYTRRGLPRGPRAALQLAVFAREFEETTVLTGVLPALQRPMLPALAWLGRRIGGGRVRSSRSDAAPNAR